jgi:hypothetical protein
MQTLQEPGILVGEGEHFGGQRAVEVREVEASRRLEVWMGAGDPLRCIVEVGGAG